MSEIPRVRVLGLSLAAVLLVAMPGVQDVVAGGADSGASTAPFPGNPGIEQALQAALDETMARLIGPGWTSKVDPALVDDHVKTAAGFTPQWTEALGGTTTLQGVAEVVRADLLETVAQGQPEPATLDPDRLIGLLEETGIDLHLAQGHLASSEVDLQDLRNAVAAPTAGGGSTTTSSGDEHYFNRDEVENHWSMELVRDHVDPLVGLVLTPVLLVFMVVYFAAVIAINLSLTALAPLGPQIDKTRNAIGDLYETAYDLASRTVLDPDTDDAWSVTEYQWRTIPVNDAVVPEQNVTNREEPYDEQHKVFPNAPDYDGDAWMDGPEITYWSAYLDQWLRHTVTAAEDGGQVASVEEDLPTWQDLVDALNRNTVLAWRHPGFYLDTDGDGLINVWDPDSDNDGLLDGHTVTFAFDDPRYDCFARRSVDETHCDPYTSHTLVYDQGSSKRTFPGEMTLGTYPEFADSDCLSTLPGSGQPTQCHPSREIDRRGEPGHGDGIDDAAEYRYWASLLSDDDYQAHFPNVTEPWNHSYDWDRVDNALLDADSDDDGLLDGEEILGCRMNPEGECVGGFATTDPWRRDTDGDGLSDAEEDAWGTDPRDWDTDDDGLPDGWEAWYGFDPLTWTDRHADPDHDGLSTWQEYCQGAEGSCAYDGDPLWTANWCGPNPRLSDTNGNGTLDGDDSQVVYDCTPPTRIGDGRGVVEPWAEPNYDLGYIDPTSKSWLKTGQYAKKHAADPVNFANRTFTNPEQVLREIRENLTQDTETLERFVLPPTVRHEAWPVKQELQRRVEPLLTCADQAVTDAFELTRSGPQEVASTTALGDSTPTQDGALAVHGPPLPPADDTSAPQAWLGDQPTVKHPVAMPKSVDCALGHVHRTVDEARDIVASALPTAPLVFADKLSQRVKQQAHDPPDPVQLVPETLPEPKNLTFDVPNLPLVDATFEDLNSQVLEPAITDPWSLVSEPNAFPNLASDLTANDLAPPTLYDELVAADELTSDNIGLVTTTDAATWDLLLVFPNGTRQQVQNIPVGTPRPVHLYKDCVDNPANTTQLLGALSCTADLAEPDLIVELTPEASAGGHAGYAFTATTTTTQSLPVLAAALIQLPNQDRGLAMGLDGRPDAAEAVEPGTTVAPLPGQFTLTGTVNTTRSGDVKLGLTQANNTTEDEPRPLVVTGGLYSIDPHDPDKPRLDTPRTEATVLLTQPPTHATVHVVQSQDAGQDQERLEVTTTSTSPTPVTASIHHLDQETQFTGLVTLDALPATSTVTIEESPTTTRIAETHTPHPSTPLTNVTLHGWLRTLENGAWTEPDLIDLLVLDPPTSATFLLDQPSTTETRLTYQANAPFTLLNATIAKPEATCKVLPTRNKVVVQPGCTHASLHGLQSARVHATPGGVETAWQRAAGAGTAGDDLGVRVDTDDLFVDALASPWTRAGNLSASWPSPVRADWGLSAPMDELDVRFRSATGPQGRLSIDDLSPTGTLNLDTSQRSFTLDDIDPEAPIGKVDAWITTGTQLPPAPATGDHVLVNTTASDQPGGTDALRARVLLHELGPVTVELDDDATMVDLQSSPGRELTVHYDAGAQRVKAHVDTMPPTARLSVQRAIDSNLTLELNHTGTTLPTVTASGQLDAIGFDVHAPSVPNQVTGYLNTREGNLGLDASSPLTVRANLTGDPLAPAPVLPLPGFAKGVSMNFQQDLANLEPGVHINLENFLHARVTRSQDPATGLKHVVAEARASQPTPLAIATLESDGTAHAAEIQDVPADADFNVSFNDNGGQLTYAASHPVDAFQIATLPAPEEDGAREQFAAYGTDVPRFVNATWDIPDDLVNGTLTANMDHSGATPITELEFQYVQDPPDTELRTVRALHAKDLSSPVEFTLEDRHNVTLDLGATGTATELAALFATQMPRDRITMPGSESHGIHVQRETPQRYSVAARFLGPHSFEGMEIPTETQPQVLIDATLDNAAPFTLYIDDDPRNLQANVSLDRLGGGPLHLDGLLAFAEGIGGVRAHLNTTLPTSPGTISFDYANAQSWLQGRAETQATVINATFALPDILLEANQPLDLTIHGAPTGTPAPAPSAGSNAPDSHVIIDRTGDAPLLGVDVDGVQLFDLSPGGNVEFAWDATDPQDLLVQFLNATTQLRELRVDDLPAVGSTTLEITPTRFAGTLDIGTDTIDRLTLDLSKWDDAEAGASNQGSGPAPSPQRLLVQTTFTGVQGSGTFTFDPDEKAVLSFPSGIDVVRGQVVKNATADQRINTLDTQRGFVFDQPVGGTTWYQSAIVANLTEVAELDVSLAKALPADVDGDGTLDQPGGLQALGTLTLTQDVSDPLRVRVNVPTSYVDATASNLPTTTAFHLDTRETQPMRLNLDWPSGQVEEVTGQFRTYQDDAGQARETDLKGNFTLRNVANLSLSKQGALDETLDVVVGGVLDRANVRIDQDTNRTRMRADELAGTYTTHVVNKGEAGAITLTSGAPAGLLDVEYKGQDAFRLVTEVPQYLIASKDTDGDADGGAMRYAHARLQGLREATWDAQATTGTGLDATLVVDPTEDQAVVGYVNQTQEIAALIDELPVETQVHFANQDDTTTIQLNVSEPIDVPGLTYINRTTTDWGVINRAEAPVNVSLDMRLTDLEDTRIEFTTLGENGDWVNLSTDGVREARLFGVMRGEHDAPRQGKHVLLHVEDVQPSSMTVHHRGQDTSAQAPYVTFESTRPIGQAAVAYKGPVFEDPQQWDWPENLYHDFVNIEDMQNKTFRGLEQRVMQVNLTDVQKAVVDPATPVPGCAGCAPLSVHLERAGANELPLSVNFNTTFGDAKVDGVFHAKRSGDIMDLRTGINTSAEASEGQSKLRTLAVDYDASGPLEEVDMDLLIRKDDEPVKVTGTVQHFPSKASFAFERAPELTEAAQACGLSFVEKLPGRVTMATGVPTNPILGVDIGFGSGRGDHLVGDDHDNYVGIQTNGSSPHTWVKANQLTRVDVALAPDASAGGRVTAEVELEGLQGLMVQYVNTHGTNVTGDDQRLNVTLEGLSWPLAFECTDGTLQAHAGTLNSPSAATLVNRVLVQGENLEVMDRNTTGFRVEAKEVTGGFVMEKTPEDAPTRKLVVKPAVTGAKASFLSARGNLEAPSAAEAQACRDAPPDLRPLEINWTLPVDGLGAFWLTTKPVQDGMPVVLENVARVVATCDEFSLLGRLAGLNTFQINTDCEWTTVDLKQKGPRWTWLESRVRDCKKAEAYKESYKKLVVNQAPKELWVKTNIHGAEEAIACGREQLNLFSSSDCLTVANSEEIGNFDYYAKCPWGDALVHAQTWRMPASSTPRQLQLWEWGSLGTTGLGTFAGNCVATTAALEAGIDGASRYAVKVSDGARTYLDAFWTGLKEDLTFSIDLDGWGGQRDQPRFEQLQGTFNRMRAETGDVENDKGVVVEWNQGEATVDMQGQWYQNGGGGSDAQANGIFEVPSWMTEPQCLDWNRTPDPDLCEDWESWEEVQERVAEDFLHDVVTYRDGSDHKIPVEAWKETVR